MHKFKYYTASQFAMKNRMEVLRTRKFYAILAAVVLISAASFALVNAQTSNPIPATHKFVYTVKFICNTPPSPEGMAETIGLASGTYWTDINVHNPSYTRTYAPFTMKLVVAMPYSGVGPYHAMPDPYELLPIDQLSPDAAMRLDCTEILKALTPAAIPPGITTAKGFVILYSSIKLDVVAEYTAGTSLGGISIDTQYIQPQAFTK
jgi:hypothetical protein